MIRKFHSTSQRELVKPLSSMPYRVERDTVQTRMVPIKDSLEEYKQFMQMTTDESRLYWLNTIQGCRKRVQESAGNQWSVYELCKNVYELAEIDRVNFNGSSLRIKLRLIRSMIPFADAFSLWEGVVEYHISRESENWQMHYLEQAEVTM